MQLYWEFSLALVLLSLQAGLPPGYVASLLEGWVQAVEEIT